MTESPFIQNLQNICLIAGEKEKSVARVWDDFFEKNLKVTKDGISNPYKCDAYFEFENKGTKKNCNQKKTRVIVEYKYGVDFSNQSEFAKVLGQLLFYVKKFDLDGKALPNILILADDNECIILKASDLWKKYLDDSDIDWTASPSNWYKTNSDLWKKLVEDSDISSQCFIHCMNSSEVACDIIDRLNKIAESDRVIRISENNISSLYENFYENVLKESLKIPPNDKVAIFLGTFLDPEEFYRKENSSNQLFTPFGTFSINGANLDRMKSAYSLNFTWTEKKRLHEISDKLIEEENRRGKGEYYTPVNFAVFAHDEVSKWLGDNWKNEYVVWDCCCGTKNLTRDYEFKELYCSTLEQAELEISSKYNPEAVSFQCDFINDTDEEIFAKCPSLKKAFDEKKPIVFEINPPYHSATGYAGKKGNNSHNKSMMAIEMKKICGNQEMLTQFLYRILMFKQKYSLNIKIALFSKASWLSKTAFKRFRNVFLKEFHYKNGYMFNSGCFSNVRNNWAMTLTFWESI